MLHLNNSKAAYTPKFLRQRKFLIVMPVAVIPLVTFLLWSAGLVGSVQTNNDTVAKSNGLNTTLPGASTMKDSSWSKLNYYEAADKEASKKASLAKSDPYYQLAPMEVVEETDTNLLPVSTKKRNGMDPYVGNGLQNSHTGLGSKDPNEVKVYQKLDALNKALAEDRPASANNSALNNLPSQSGASTNDNDISRLEAMMQQLNSTGNTTNPEMDQINGMLEKILDIQHPERIKDRTQEISSKNKEEVFPVEPKSNGLTVTTLQNAHADNEAPTKPLTTVSPVKFYSLDEDEAEKANDSHNAIKAVIPEQQVLVSGATVKLQFTEEVYISGVRVPKGQTVFGEAGLQNERLKIEIHSIRYNNAILPVKLSVYDLDGVEGLYMPGAIGREVAKQSTDQAIQSMGISSLDPSLGAQAATAGIQAAKSLIGRKAKQVRVTVRSGYEVLLRDETSKN